MRAAECLAAYVRHSTLVRGYMDGIRAWAGGRAGVAAVEQAAGRRGDGVAMQVVLPASMAGPRGGEPPWCGGEDGGCGGRSGRWRGSAV